MVVVQPAGSQNAERSRNAAGSGDLAARAAEAAGSGRHDKSVLVLSTDEEGLGEQTLGETLSSTSVDRFHLYLPLRKVWEP